MESSSEIFIRRFMRSKIAKRLDNESVLESNIQANDILQLVDEEYGVSDYVCMQVITIAVTLIR